LEESPADVRRFFVTAHDIAPEWHIRMQAAYQRHVDNAVSKTANFPHSATREDIATAYLLAYQLGCKGLTIYRDGSRQEQVLNRGPLPLPSVTKPKPDKGVLAPRSRPMVTKGATEKIALGCNRTLYVTINEDNEGLCEVFLHMGKSGGCTASQSEAIGRLISLALRSGIETEVIIRQLKGIRCPSPSWHNGGSALSCSDAIAKSIERYTGGHAGNPKGKVMARTSAVRSMPDISPECPECGEILEPSEGCVVCRSCGYSECS
jgi:ribonucleoside-diphosphate reductase alpha chain